MSFVERFRKIVAEDFSSQNDLARTISASKVTISGYSSGKQKPNYDILSKLYDLGYSIDWLISGKGSMKRTDISSELTYILVFENNITYTSMNPNFEEAKIVAEAEQIKNGLGRNLRLVITIEEGKIVKITDGELSL